MYTQILNDDPSNMSAWLGLVSAHHSMGQDTQAMADVQRMPACLLRNRARRSRFLSMLGAIYQQANQLEVAQGLLERSVKLQTAAGGQPSVALELQLAGIYLLRNDTEQAYAIYRRVLTAHPGPPDAWKGLIQPSGHQPQRVRRSGNWLDSARVRKQLENDLEFVQTEAGIYASAGDTAHAVDYMNRVQAHYARLKMQPPANLDIQNAWLLYNTGNDRALYPGADAAGRPRTT